MKRRIAFVHASPAAVAPLAGFYKEAAPELDFTNLLDDRVLRFFAAGQTDRAGRRLAQMIETARDDYAAELVMLTCSSVSRKMRSSLEGAAGIPVLKIDEPAARAAVRIGGRIGVAVTFAPTLSTTTALLDEAAEEAGREVEIVPAVAISAYEALLAGNESRHDELLVAAVKGLERQNVDAILLAQVSMARVLPRLEEGARVPVLSSLPTSLTAVRAALAESPGNVR